MVSQARSLCGFSSLDSLLLFHEILSRATRLLCLLCSDRAGGVRGWEGDQSFSGWFLKLFSGLALTICSVSAFHIWTHVCSHKTAFIYFKCQLPSLGSMFKLVQVSLRGIIKSLIYKVHIDFDGSFWNFEYVIDIG